MPRGDEKGRRGRRNKPAALRLLENQRFGEKDITEPRVEVKAPSAPKWLTKKAKYYWKHIGARLAQHNLITKLDREAFAIFCQSYADWIELEVQKHKLPYTYYESPNGCLLPHPLFAQAEKMKKSTARALVEFGLSPTSRAGLTIFEGEKDPYEEWRKMKDKRKVGRVK